MKPYSEKYPILFLQLATNLTIILQGRGRGEDGSREFTLLHTWAIDYSLPPPLPRGIATFFKKLKFGDNAFLAHFRMCK